MSAVYGVMCDADPGTEMVVSPHSLHDARARAKAQGWTFERGGPGVPFRDFCEDHHPTSLNSERQE